MRKLTNFDKIFKAVEILTGRHIVFIHGEGSNYAFKYFDTQKWDTAKYYFINDLAGLSSSNDNLLQVVIMVFNDLEIGDCFLQTDMEGYVFYKDESVNSRTVTSPSVLIKTGIDKYKYNSDKTGNVTYRCNVSMPVKKNKSWEAL